MPRQAAAASDAPDVAHEHAPTGGQAGPQDRDSNELASPSMPATASPPFQPPRPPAKASLGRQLALLVFDIGAPTGLYYALHGAGLSNLAALSIAAVLPALAAVCKLVVKHRVDAVALVVLATIVLTVVLSLVAHNPRFLLARDGLITALWGFWFIATVRGSRPAAFLFARPLMEGRKVFGTRPWDWLWETDARFRRIWRISTVIWGAGMLADAVIRVVMAYSLPVEVVPALGGALWPVTFLLIQVVTNIYYRRAGLYRILGAGWLARR
jgi:hypothetical protein